MKEINSQEKEAAAGVKIAKWKSDFRTEREHAKGRRRKKDNRMRQRSIERSRGKHYIRHEWRKSFS